MYGKGSVNSGSRYTMQNPSILQFLYRTAAFLKDLHQILLMMNFHNLVVCVTFTQSIF